MKIAITVVMVVGVFVQMYLMFRMLRNYRDGEDVIHLVIPILIITAVTLLLNNISRLVFD